ncbi:hypothetical protein [Streptomyces sp. NPDC056987]
MEADDTEATAEFIEADQRMPALLVGIAKNRLRAIERETDVA